MQTFWKSALISSHLRLKTKSSSESRARSAGSSYGTGTLCSTLATSDRIASLAVAVIAQDEAVGEGGGGDGLDVIGINGAVAVRAMRRPGRRA